MPATVVITAYRGAAAATTDNIDGTAIRYKQADNHTVDALNPIPIPGAGTAYSWIKHMKFNVTVAPANLINNLKVYSDGANGLGTGMDLLVGENATYTNPTTQAATLYVAATLASVFGYSSGSPLTLSGSPSISTTGTVGNYVVTQFSVASTATQGNSGTEVITFSFDES